MSIGGPHEVLPPHETASSRWGGCGADSRARTADRRRKQRGFRQEVDDGIHHQVGRPE